ncbi:hypothetical protein TNCV_2778141 [Trichonephila clavipes]|nr:hypothetical protein TNCV_2778141 [Trichonephila clavipes]
MTCVPTIFASRKSIDSSFDLTHDHRLTKQLVLFGGLEAGRATSKPPKRTNHYQYKILEWNKDLIQERNRGVEIIFP